MSTTQNKSNQGPIVVGIILLALIIGGVVWSNLGEGEDKSSTDKKPSTAVASTESSTATKTPSATAASKTSDEAKRMMNTAVAKEKQTRQKETAALNQRLAKEAEARVKAEKASKDLTRSLSDLKRMLKQAEAKRAKLIADGDTNSRSYTQLTNRINNLRNEISKTEPSTVVAKESYDKARRKQHDTEQIIIQGGGEIELPDYLILSRNYKRRNALLMDARFLRDNQ